MIMMIAIMHRERMRERVQAWPNQAGSRVDDDEQRLTYLSVGRAIHTKRGGKRNKADAFVYLPPK